jgi:hypothetical protein
MQSSECRIAFINKVQLKQFSDVDYDMYVTDRRLVLIHINVAHGGALAGLALGGIFGAAIGSELEKSKQTSNNKNEREIITLGELLAKDKKSFEIPYEDIEKIRLRSFLTDYNLFVTAKKNKAKFAMTSKQLEQLSTILPSIPALKGKL